MFFFQEWNNIDYFVLFFSFSKFKLLSYTLVFLLSMFLPYFLTIFLFISTSFDISKYFWSLENLLSQHVWLFYIFIAAYCIFSFILFIDASFNLHRVFLGCLLLRPSAVDKVFKSWPLRYIYKHKYELKSFYFSWEKIIMVLMLMHFFLF